MTEAHDRFYEQAQAMLWELNAHVCREDDDGLCFKCMGILTDGLAAAAQPVWTKEKPTTPGWYWFRHPKHNGEHEVVWVFRGRGADMGVVSTDGWTIAPGKLRGEWAGPLQPPKEQT